MRDSVTKKPEEYIDIEIVDVYYEVINHVIPSEEKVKFFQDIEQVLSILKEKSIKDILVEKLINIKEYTKALNIIEKNLELSYKTKLFLLNIRENGHYMYLKELLKLLYEYWIDEYSVMHAQLITSASYPIEGIRLLEEKLTQHYNKKVLLQSIVHPKIMGGFKLKIDEKLIDMSYENTLSKIFNYIDKRLCILD